MEQEQHKARTMLWVWIIFCTYKTGLGLICEEFKCLWQHTCLLSLQIAMMVGYTLPSSSNSMFRHCPCLWVAIYFQMSFLWCQMLFVCLFYTWVVKPNICGVWILFSQCAIDWKQEEEQQVRFQVHVLGCLSSSSQSTCALILFESQSTCTVFVACISTQRWIQDDYCLWVCPALWVIMWMCFLCPWPIFPVIQEVWSCDKIINQQEVVFVEHCLAIGNSGVAWSMNDWRIASKFVRLRVATKLPYPITDIAQFSSI